MNIILNNTNDIKTIIKSTKYCTICYYYVFFGLAKPKLILITLLINGPTTAICNSKNSIACSKYYTNTE